LLLSKKYAAHFFEFRQAGTEPKDAAYPVTVLNSMVTGSKDKIANSMLLPKYLQRIKSKNLSKRQRNSNG
jgi:glutamine synthetase type III